MSQCGLALITTYFIVTFGAKCHSLGWTFLQPVELSLCDISPTFWAIFGVDVQSVHFESNCHSGRPVTVDQSSSGRSMRVEMSLGCSVGGRSVKAPGMHSTIAPLYFFLFMFLANQQFIFHNFLLCCPLYSILAGQYRCIWWVRQQY